MDDLDVFGEARSGGRSDEQPLTRAERRDYQTQRIMDAAKACFVRSGFQGASMQQICAEAGMSPGALYRYFPSKEAIIEAICEADRREDAEIFAAMLSAPDLVEGFTTAAMMHMRHISETGNAPLFAEMRAESMRNEAVRICRERCMGEVEKAFYFHMKNGIEQGDIDPVVDLETLMPAIMAIGEGLAVNDLLTHGVKEDQLATFLRAIADAVLRPKKPVST
jgi:TetR/AcrR family transcriptional regulator, repressor for uid operon